MRPTILITTVVVSTNQTAVEPYGAADSGREYNPCPPAKVPSEKDPRGTVSAISPSTPPLEAIAMVQLVTLRRAIIHEH